VTVPSRFDSATGFFPAAQMTKLFFATLDSLRMGIMQGRNSPGEWDGAIKNWRQKAGDKMRAEYEQAWEARSS
ncbi:hypothetical protein ACWGCP_37230, partial [Streptomyces niveus]